MVNIITGFVVTFMFFMGFVVPLFWWIWIGFCKYILHFHKGCSNLNCLYRCKKCPRLHSEALQKRIIRLEQQNIKDKGYIAFLSEQLYVYLQSPDLDRETDSKMIHRLVKQAKEKSRCQE